MNQKENAFPKYPAALVNITKRCNLRSKHCFVYRDGNPNDRRDEMDTPILLEKLAKLKKRHGIQAMLWMGGEPLLKSASAVCSSSAARSSIFFSRFHENDGDIVDASLLIGQPNQ